MAQKPPVPDINRRELVAGRPRFDVLKAVMNVAVCLLPGTELSFAYPVKRARLWPWIKNIIPHATVIFRQVNLDCSYAHHDALEFPDGELVPLTYLNGRTTGYSPSAAS